MRKRAVILIVLIVVLPLSLLAWAVTRIAASEQRDVESRFQNLMEQRVLEVNRDVSAFFSDAERELLRITAIDESDIEKLRDINRSEPRLLQLFVLSADGDLRYPAPTSSLNGSEQSFLLRASKMFTDQDLQNAVELKTWKAESNSADTTADYSTSGWFVWYWDRGLNLVFWQRRPSGEIVGAALERARWISDLIGRLPDTQPSLVKSAETQSSGGPAAGVQPLLRLVDAGGDLVYQWGDMVTGDGSESPLCEVAVAAPLSSWRLQCFVPAAMTKSGGRRSVYLSLIGGLVAAGLGLAALATMLFRDYSRDMREAAQQVSFVNQVSHELKTPLTNIRLYAELLESDLQGLAAEDSLRPKQRLQVIHSEGQRLSRLISNVLSFARQKRQTLQPRRVLQVPDELIVTIVDRFRPALAVMGIEPTLDGNASDPALIDPDFLEQILGNLISNVEKHAAAGRTMHVRSSRMPEELIIEVNDTGPGISATRQKDIFVPFNRCSTDLSAVAGTGIGLSIARELARLHGGDLELIQSERGCCFRMRLRTVCDSETTV